MNQPPTQDGLEIEVKDFGPIIEAKVALRPLTVFVGPSNTGKSWLAVLIYALHRYFDRRHWLHGNQQDSPRGRYRDGELSRETVGLLTELAEQVWAGEGKFLSRQGFVLPAQLVDLICSGLGIGDLFGKEITRCFGIRQQGALIRNGARGSASIAFRKSAESGETPFDHRLTISADASDFKTSFPIDTPIRLNSGAPIEYLRRWAKDMTWPDDLEEKRLPLSRWKLLADLTDFTRFDLFGLLNQPAFYLPAGRTGIMHTRSAVTSGLIRQAAVAEDHALGTPAPMLSGVVADFLEQLVEPDTHGNRHGSEHAARIEDAILEGSVNIEKAAGIGHPHFTYMPKGWKHSLSLMNASSMVSELAPLVLYLRHMLDPDQVLIVEEPESDLHPAMQVELIRQLAAVVNSGIRVIVITHSEWVLEELDNIVRRSHPKAAGKESVEDKVALRPDQVGAWLFRQKKRPRGSVVEELKMDDETGRYPTGFGEVAINIHNDWADVTSRIENAK